MNKKGFYPLYTTLGVVLIIIAVLITLQLEVQSTYDFNLHVDRLTWLKINSAIENVRALVSDSLKDTFQKSVLDIGKIGNGTINPYLVYSKEEGWDQIVSDINKKTSENFNSILPGIADYSNGGRFVFVLDDGINITLDEISTENLDVVETEDGLLARAQLPLTITNRFEGWAESLYSTNISIPLGIRLKDVYERAWEFNDHYQDIATWTFTGALYARAYAAAYLAEDGPFIKEAHYSFDPIATVLFGDVETVKTFASDPGSTVDVGAVAAATWYAEWEYLSEPSFLPAGMDLDFSNADSARDAISNNYNMNELEQMACSNESLSETEKEQCELIYDTDKLREQVKLIRDRKNGLKDILDDAQKWLKEYDTSDYYDAKKRDSCRQKHDDCMDDVDDCYDDVDECYDDVDECYDDADSDRDEKRCERKEERCDKDSEECEEDEDKCDEKYDECRDEYEGYGGRREYYISKELNRLFGRASDDVCQDFREDARELIEKILLEFDASRKKICENKIDEARSDSDSLRVDQDIKDQFESNKDEFGYSDVDIYCSTGTDTMSALQDLLSTKLKEVKIDDSLCDSSETGDCISNDDCGAAGDCDTNCDFLSCSGGGYGYECIGDLEIGQRENSCRNDEDEIDICSCRCRPSISLVDDINDALDSAQDYLKKTLDAFETTYDHLSKQLQAKEEIEKLKANLEGLDSTGESYDVFSRLDTTLVTYDKGEFSGGKMCYIDPGFDNRNDGVCGDSVESIGIYTAQIAAASLATIFTGGIGAELLEYAKDFFPIIYESGVKYTLTETLIDDGNRVILENVAGKGSELYTYAPFDFEIYKNREFDIGSATFGRTVVYLYLPLVSKKKDGLQRAMDGLSDDSCKGESC